MERNKEHIDTTNNEILKSGIVRILFANIINLAFSLGTNFLLPKYVSIESYAQIKTYQLYVSYIAVLQLGYSDGMYLKFGGKRLENIQHALLQEDISTLRVFQGIVGLVSLVFAIVVRDPVLIVASLSVFPQNVIAYYKNLYQAVGKFGDYSRIMNFTTGATFAINAVLLFVFKIDDYGFYICSYLTLSIVLMCALEIQTNRSFRIAFGIAQFNKVNLFQNINNGFLLLLANFSSILLTSMDRVFTKVLLGNIEFALYSFAVSIENFLNVAVSPLTVTLYNYFCNNKTEEKVIKIRNMIIIFSSLLISCAFPVKFIIEHYLQQYRESVNIIFLLFSAQAFLIIVRSVYLNLYKAFKMQRTYFIRMCIVISVAFILNSVFYLIMRAKEAFALGTVISSVIWLLISQWDFRNYRFDIKNILYLNLELITFLICGRYLNSIMGFITYVLLSVLLARLLLKEGFQDLCALAWSIVKKSAFKWRRGNEDD